MVNKYILFYFGKNKVRLSKNWISQFLLFSKKNNKKNLKWLINNKILQKLIYSIHVFCLHNFLIFMFFIFRIIFGWTCYGTTVVVDTSLHMTTHIYSKYVLHTLAILKHMNSTKDLSRLWRTNHVSWHGAARLKPTSGLSRQCGIMWYTKT